MAAPTALAPASRLRGAPALALALCTILTLGWAWADWRNLAALHLPDTDDVMRLVQVRDWMGGQGWRDLVQHRLGPAGVPMHWSRLGDLGPTAIIVALRPLLGTASAELVAVILWPALLFLAFLLLAASIARRLGSAGEAPIAVVIAALAWPATWVFMPGRIDHHGLQLVLLLTTLDALLRPASSRAGAILGLAVAASLTLGLETAPQLAILLALAGWFWLRAPAEEQGRILGAGAALLVGTAAAALAHPTIWPSGLCDSFTPPVAWAMGVAGLALGAVAGVPTHLVLRHRELALAGIGAVAGTAVVVLAPACLADPYAAVPPELHRLWLDQVQEAQGVLTAPLATSIGYLGVAVAGLIAAIWFARRDARWGALAALLASALLVACLQLRGAHIAAALAPPALAHLVAHARRAGALRRIGGWLVSLGLVYNLAGQAVAKEQPAATGSCDLSAGIAELRALPPGLVLAPIDVGPRILAETRHRVLAAPYHRNVAGNLAALRYASGENPDPRATGADYRLGCGGVVR